MTVSKPRILYNLLGDENKASSRVRGWWVGAEFESRGYIVTYNISNSARDALKLVVAIFFHDVVVFQKTYGRFDPWLVRFARMLGRKCYFDIDDAPSRIGNQITTRNAQKMMHGCNMVWAGSQALKDYASPYASATVLIPSAIKLDNYETNTEPSPLTVAPPCLGWVGNGAHYADDLITHLATPLADVASNRRIKFRIVGACGVPALYDTFGAIEGLEIDFIDTIEWSSSKAVSDAIAPFDIGLYPLSSDSFNDFKCGFKALEYMALGIPVIASDVAANHSILVHEHTGFLVEGDDAWIAAILTLTNDKGQCHRMGKQGRERVERLFSVSHVADLLEDIIL